MPDLFAHFTSGYLISRYPHLRGFTALIVLGAVLPDLLTRVPEIFFDRFLGLNVYHAVEIFHSPTVLFLVAFALSLLMDRSLRFQAFSSIFLGSLVHVVLDLMQIQFGESVYMPYFPFSFVKIEFGFFHFNASIAIFPLLLPLVTIAFLVSRHASKDPL